MVCENGVFVAFTDGIEFDGVLFVGLDGIFLIVWCYLDFLGDCLNYVGLCVVLGIVDEKIMNVSFAYRRIFEMVDGVIWLYVMFFMIILIMW